MNLYKYLCDKKVNEWEKVIGVITFPHFIIVVGRHIIKKFILCEGTRDDKLFNY